MLSNFKWPSTLPFLLRNSLYSKLQSNEMKKVTWSRYRPGVAQRVGRGIALLFHDRGTRRGWVVSSTPRSHFTTGKDPLPILQEAGWAPGPVWTGGKSRPHRDPIPNRPVCSQYSPMKYMIINANWKHEFYRLRMKLFVLNLHILQVCLWNACQNT